jgi:hypothetical protein
VFQIQPCSPDCPVWLYARQAAGRQGTPLILKVPPGMDTMPVRGRGVTAEATPPGHGWRECRPVILGPPGAAPADGTAVEAAWALVPDADRRLFHQFCCLRREDPEQLAAMGRITRRMRVALGRPG